MFKQHWMLQVVLPAGRRTRAGRQAPPLRPSVCRPPAARAWLLRATEDGGEHYLGFGLKFRVQGLGCTLRARVDVSDHSPSGLTPPRTARGEGSAANLRAKPQARFSAVFDPPSFPSTQTSSLQGLGFIIFLAGRGGVQFPYFGGAF